MVGMDISRCIDTTLALSSSYNERNIGEVELAILPLYCSRICGG